MTGPHRHHVEARARRLPTPRQFLADTHHHKPDAGEQTAAAINTMIEDIRRKHDALLGAIVEDIHRHGTRWAAKQIKTLREDLARCRRELRAAGAKGGAS